MTETNELGKLAVLVQVLETEIVPVPARFEQPPATDEYEPLAVSAYPPVIEENCPDAEPARPPVAVAYWPLAVLPYPNAAA
ncbi:MAG TPA: hypothetical protein VGF81_12540 [Solirubrobacteraceae bacterium]